MKIFTNLLTTLLFIFLLAGVMAFIGVWEFKIFPDYYFFIWLSFYAVIAAVFTVREQKLLHH